MNNIEWAVKEVINEWAGTVTTSKAHAFTEHSTTTLCGIDTSNDGWSAWSEASGTADRCKRCTRKTG